MVQKKLGLYWISIGIEIGGPEYLGAAKIWRTSLVFTSLIHTTADDTKRATVAVTIAALGIFGQLLTGAP